MKLKRVVFTKQVDLPHRDGGMRSFQCNQGGGKRPEIDGVDELWWDRRADNVVAVLDGAKAMYPRNTVVETMFEWVEEPLKPKQAKPESDPGSVLEVQL